MAYRATRRGYTRAAQRQLVDALGAAMEVPVGTTATVTTAPPLDTAHAYAAPILPDDMPHLDSSKPSTSVVELPDRELERLLTDHMVIEGGHYNASEPIDPVVEWTWRRAVELYATALRRGLVNIGLALMIDDFAVPSAQRDTFRASYRLPDSFRRSLDDFQVDPAAVTVVWEVQLRNRARHDLHRRLKPRLTPESDGYYVRCHDGTYRPATSITTPVCNLIVARHIADKDRLYRHALNLYDLRWECQSGGGVVVSRPLYDTSITVYNVYITVDRRVGFMVVHEGRSDTP